MICRVCSGYLVWIPSCCLRWEMCRHEPNLKGYKGLRIGTFRVFKLSNWIINTVRRIIPHDCVHFWWSNCRPHSSLWWLVPCTHYAISCTSNKCLPRAHYFWCIYGPYNEAIDCREQMIHIRFHRRRQPVPFLAPLFVSISFVLVSGPWNRSHPPTCTKLNDLDFSMTGRKRVNGKRNNENEKKVC